MLWNRNKAQKCQILFLISKQKGSKTRRLLGSKRALYLVNTSEEFCFFYRCKCMLIRCCSYYCALSLTLMLQR